MAEIEPRNNGDCFFLFLSGTGYFICIFVCSFILFVGWFVCGSLGTR